MACNGVAEGGSGMYKIKPYYDTEAPIQLSNCMYKLDNVYGDKIKSGSDSKDIGGASNEVAELEKRQERILARLEELRLQVAMLATANCSTSATNAVPPQCSVVLPPQKRPCRGANDIIEDIVITADPTNPPLSLFILQDLLSHQYSVLPTYYVHSSAKGKVPARLQEVLRSDGIAANRNAYQLGFTVIWKEDKYGPALTVSPNVQTTIRRECNVARHLARLLAPRYDQPDAGTATQIDAMVDIAAAILRADAAKMAAHVKSVSAKLGKSRWILGGDGPTLADIVLWSALQQSRQTSKAPDNVRRWLDACSQRPEFAIARQLI